MARKTKDITVAFGCDTLDYENAPHGFADAEKKNLAGCARLYLNADHPAVEKLDGTYEVIYDGISPLKGRKWSQYGVNIKRGKLVGTPCPVIRFRLRTPIDPDFFVEQMRWASMSICSAARSAKGLDPEFHFIDEKAHASRLTVARRKEWEAVTAPQSAQSLSRLSNDGCSLA